MTLNRGAMGNVVGPSPATPIVTDAPALPDAAVVPDVSMVPDASEPADPVETGDDRAIADGLAKYVRDAYTQAKEQRQMSGVDDDLLAALRAVRGEYDAVKKAEIRKAGTDVYLRISANKVRSVAAALRDVYASNDRPWGIEPTPEPEMPLDNEKEKLISQILMQEAQEAVANGAGASLTPQMLFNRRRDLRDLFYQHTQLNARNALRQRENQMDDILTQGGFYQALWDFLLDIPTFPYAVLKGPVVYYKNQLHWEGNKPVVKSEPTMTWERCSPFDVYFAPWAQSAQDGYIVHRQRCTRATLQALIGLPSYNTANIMEVLSRDTDAYKDWYNFTEQERAELEHRDSDQNSAHSGNAVDKPFPMLEFHGPVSGRLLVEWGMDAKQVPDDSKDLDITCWLIDDLVIGVRLNPHPMGNKPFYVDSFERVPGSIYGLGVPKMIEDIQDAGAATLRALVNNMAIASGPQVAVNEPRLDETETEIKMYPWKIWAFTDDPSGTGAGLPITFFQPQSNAAELLGVLKQFTEMADTYSSMPQYMQGNAEGMSTIGRTSSGLSMLMDAANRTLKQSVTSIDKNVVEAVVRDLNLFLAIVRPDLVDDGDINIVAKGATELVQREQLRMRRIQFLQATQNPMDAQIIGIPGRKAIISEVARDLGLPVDQIVTGAASMSPMQPQQQSAAPPNGGAMEGPAAPGPAPGPKDAGAIPPSPAGADGGSPAANMAAPAKA